MIERQVDVRALFEVRELIDWEATLLSGLFEGAS